MTLVIVLQLLLASLAGLLLLERRLNERELPVTDTAAPIDFHPELITRWDDEAVDARTDVCTRRSIAPRPSARPVSPAPGRRSHLR